MLTLIIIGLFVFLSVWFVRYMVAKDRGHKEPVGALWAACSFGALGIVGAIFLEQLFLPKELVPGQTVHMPLGSLAYGSLLIGIIEESCKFLPLAFYIYNKPYFDEHTDGVLYFAIAGLGFGLPENIFYTLAHGAVTGALRIVLTLLFHSATTALIGYYLARRKLDGVAWGYVGAAAVTAILLHGAYDFGEFSGRGLFIVISFGITFSLTSYLFVLLRRSGKADVLAGLSSEGNNTFCRHCGAPNANHNLYCVRCGKRA